MWHNQNTIELFTHRCGGLAPPRRMGPGPAPPRSRSSSRWATLSLRRLNSVLHCTCLMATSSPSTLSHASYTSPKPPCPMVRRRSRGAPRGPMPAGRQATCRWASWVGIFQPKKIEVKTTQKPSKGLFFFWQFSTPFPLLFFFGKAAGWKRGAGKHPCPTKTPFMATWQQAEHPLRTKIAHLGGT